MIAMEEDNITIINVEMIIVVNMKTGEEETIIMKKDNIVIMKKKTYKLDKMLKSRIVSMMISMKKEKTIEEVVEEDIITIETEIMIIVTETTKIETEIMKGTIMKERIKIEIQESIKTETMETNNTKKEIMIKITNHETEKIIVNPETMIMTEEKEERKSITLKMNPERRNK